MSESTKRDARLIVGGVPRVELLPPELKQEAKARSERRRLGGVVLLVVVLVAAGYAYVALLAQTSDLQLKAANNRTDELLSEQASLSGVRQLAAQVQASKDANGVAMAPEIDWQDYLAQIEQGLITAGASVVKFDATSSSPFVPLAAPSAVLEGPRVAEIKFVGASLSYPSVASWMDELQKLPGFADATVVKITKKEGYYEMEVVLHVNEGAYSNRFAAKSDEEAADTSTDATETETTETEVTP